MKTKATNGLTNEELAQTAFRVFHGENPQPWESLNEEQQMGWVAVGTYGIGIVDLPPDSNDVVNVSAAQFGRDCCDVFHKALGHESAPLNAPVIAWEAVARHLANCIDADAPVETDDLEARMWQWLESRRLVLA